MKVDIKDRVALGDDKYTIEDLPDGRKRLVPEPDSVEEPGTPINKQLLQPLFDHSILFQGILRDSDDCNTVLDTGRYVYFSDSVPENAPFENGTIIEVLGTNEQESQKVQRAYRYDKSGVFAFRAFMNGVWSVWRYPILTENNSQSLIAEDFCFSEVRLPPFEKIDNSIFADKFIACADTWIQATVSGNLRYGSLTTGANIDGEIVDLMESRINPMLYAVKKNGIFTKEYRDIWADVKSGKVDKEGEKSTINCISLCNMILMGVPFEYSRLSGDENVIGAAGYFFDVIKYLDGSFNGEYIGYNPHKHLDVTTFQNILTQSSFFSTYSKLGLTRTVKTAKDETDGQIWYNQIKAGDILWTGSHSLFCLSVTESEDSVVLQCVEAQVDSAKAKEIRKINITVTNDGTLSNNIAGRIKQVARPYLSYSSASTNTDSLDTSAFKRIKGPYVGIPSNADLNTYLTVGEYRCISNANINSMANKPDLDTDDLFRLSVENLTQPEEELDSGDRAFLQTLVTAKNKIFTRTISTYWKKPVSNATFSPWQRIDTAETRQSIPEAADLNTYTTVGVYICGTSVKATGLYNRPAGMTKAFRLTVENTTTEQITLAASTYFTQRIRDISGQEYWRRIFYKDGKPDFGQWNKIVTEVVELANEKETTQ